MSLIRNNDREDFIDKVVRASDRFDEHSGEIPKEKWYSCFDVFLRSEITGDDVDDKWLERQKKKVRGLRRIGSFWD